MSTNNEPSNLCRPDERKSCAACCGLYNVADGTGETLAQKLHHRTDLFFRTGRSADELVAFETSVRTAEATAPVDPVIHVCEFTGFVDSERRIVGCLLHPTSPGNRGIDLRGLCHYGSLACRSFYCPAWESLDPAHIACVTAAVDDWHLYGLVITDVEFLRSLFRLLEEVAGGPLDPQRVFETAAGDVLREMLAWKNSSTLSARSPLRRSRYYGKLVQDQTAPDRDTLVGRVVEALASNFGMDGEPPGFRDVVMDGVERFGHAC